MTNNHSFAIGNLVLPIHIRRHKTSRRIIVRYQPAAQIIALTIPRYVSIRQGLSFVEDRRAWIAARIDEHPVHTPFADGQTIPVLGCEYTLKHVGGRGVVRIESRNPSPLGRGLGEGYSSLDKTSGSPHPILLPEGEGIILVPGEAEFMTRRVGNFLKHIAKAEIEKLVAIKKPLLGKAPRKISLRDTRSRWGSCSADGNLSFSWRIIMAPPEVLDYLVSHEMAHLLHMNHSPKFWKTVAMLCPDFKRRQQWLKTHGTGLHSYG